MLIGGRRILSGVLVAALTSAASGDAVFNIWIEAPTRVIAGETFTASLWGEVSGSILETSDGGWSGLYADMLATGVGAHFSTAIFPFMNQPLDFGTPEPNALRHVWAGNIPTGPFFFYDDNPLLLFSAEVTTVSTARGSLELTISPVEGAPSMLGWWLDYGDASAVFDTDPGSSRIITPTTVNVIPAPASFGLLALAGVGAVRRRR